MIRAVKLCNCVCLWVHGCSCVCLPSLWGAGVSPVLKSPDGNWLALQTAQMSRPGLLAKRRSLVFSALEKESGVKSAYEVLDSDNETKPEPDWGAVLQEIHRKMTGSNLHLCGDQMSPPASRNGDIIHFSSILVFLSCLVVSKR